MYKTELNKDATIYTYTLLSKVHSRLWFICLYGSLPIICFLYEIVQRFDFIFILTLPIGFMLIHVFYVVIIKLYLKYSAQMRIHPWTILIRLPWIGYLPKEPLFLHQHWKLQIHLFAAGLAIISCLYPWVSPIVLGNLFFSHVWIMLPRFIILFIFRRQGATGIVKINTSDTSYYGQ